MKGNIVQIVSKMIDPIANELSLDVVQITYRKQGKDWVLTVAIDRPPEGVTIDDCERVNRALSKALDEVDIIDNAYMLEVSSPGAERKLKDFEDFKKQVGRYVQLVLRESINGQNKITGYLKEAGSENKIVLENQDGIFELSYEKIARANLAIQF